MGTNVNYVRAGFRKFGVRCRNDTEGSDMRQAGSERMEQMWIMKGNDLECGLGWKMIWTGFVRITRVEFVDVLLSV